MGRWLLPFVWQAVVTVILIWNRKLKDNVYTEVYDFQRRKIIDSITFSFWVQTLIQTTEMPRLEAANNRNASTYNSFFLKKTNYLRLKNAQLGYYIFS